MGRTFVAIPSAGIELAGVFDKPGGEGPFPAGLIIAGSGPLDRDGNTKQLALGVSRDVAELAATQGWASLRFDKRGVGDSGGDYLRTGFYEELADVEAAHEWLTGRPEVSAIIPIGHSVGATMAAELAVQHPEPAGAVLLAFSAKTGAETLVWQAQRLKDHLLPRPARWLLAVFGTDIVKQQRKAMAKLEATTEDVVRVQMAKVNAKWMREFIAYDPMPTLRQVRAPLLAITGSKDVQVDPADLATVADLVPSAEVHEVEGVDHILREEPAEVSNPRFYKKQLAKPIDPRVARPFADWLAGRSAGPSPP